MEEEKKRDLELAKQLTSYPSQNYAIFAILKIMLKFFRFFYFWKTHQRMSIGYIHQTLKPWDVISRKDYLKKKRDKPNNLEFKINCVLRLISNQCLFVKGKILVRIHISINE